MTHPGYASPDYFRHTCTRCGRGQLFRRPARRPVTVAEFERQRGRLTLRELIAWVGRSDLDFTQVLATLAVWAGPSGEGAGR